LWAFFACVAVVLMMTHISLDVLLRWIGLPIPATVTIVPHYYMLPIVFLPLALAEKNDSHITVEILVQLFRSRLQRILAVCSWLFSAAVFSILFYQTFLDALDKMSVGTFMIEVDWKIPIWASYFFLPAGFGLVILVLLYKIITTISEAESGLGEKQHEAFDQTTIDLEKKPHG
jgi:TRAP-type C4-dicarboxylate transport system permease small subunit